MVVQGITNTVGAVPGIVGVALTGYIFDQTDSWKVRRGTRNDVGLISASEYSDQEDLPSYAPTPAA